MAEAILEWERDAFEEEKECHEDDLDQALTAKDGGGMYSDSDRPEGLQVSEA